MYLSKISNSSIGVFSDKQISGINTQKLSDMSLLSPGCTVPST